MYQAYIGLEIHIQLLTKSKVFCSCRAQFGDEPNTNVCPVCMGYPGVLPALNEEAVRMGYVVARALNCTLSRRTVFARKNYFYPDMPKNYQISQYDDPIGRDGYIDIEIGGRIKRVRVHEVHLEEDAGKMIHVGDASLCDDNRAGTPLLEIVTEPDMESGEEAEALIQEFRRMVRYLGVCDGNMEEGSLRCDANVSVNEAGKGLGTKVEIKNLNSSRFVRLALDHEIERQKALLEEGRQVVQETRLWNENRDVTESMRTKESAHDYRYFPEPDLPPFVPDEAFFAQVEASLVELPLARKQRFLSDYGISVQQADFLIEEKARADFFEEAVRRGVAPSTAAAWLAGDVAKLLNRYRVELDASPLTMDRFVLLMELLQKGEIHGRIAKQVLSAVFEEDKDPSRIIEEKGWRQLSEEELVKVVDEVITAHPKAVEQVKGGEEKPVGFLMGQVMARTAGRAHPEKTREVLLSRIRGGEG
ncbi:Asp-tRNA(Asn)/Glu-tRNA(Gln) amidotransferase subunit GatB [Spirochaeta thermophila]|uniref:Aspartyl/glutamyl-tRNA(Asn/Gln) amidotransferase subunit B n=1 Tax=Winmispira thermophila (strain ATCC 49972 / DSM 6192 / RI 19.B1) TaxID=665571 RepID=E0RRP2_WINT6|nr:Asp-tRNA(Asn)/Glu-tRNA(Gln) amidotransferase subunit GatB [Spirochaeta thermophila]ADN03146.1 aspartyl/glutamyl-tRNA(Asn/Gln) amidotransferase subunit B [Spirochaeta thermophila DSM 6192]